MDTRQFNLWLVKISGLKYLPIVQIDFSRVICDEEHRVVFIPHYGVYLFGKLDLFVNLPHASVVETDLFVVVASCQHIAIFVVELAK